MFYYLFGNIALVGGRYQITDLGSPTNQETLLISFPDGVTPEVFGESLVIPTCRYYISGLEDDLIVRVRSDGFQVVKGIVGDYLGDSIKTGYHGFMAVFMVG